MTVQAAEVATAEKTFDEIVEAWLKFLATKSAKRKKPAKPRTLEGYRYGLKVFKAWIDAAGIAISEVNEETISGWTTAMDSAKNSKGKPWSNATKNAYLAAVRSFYKWAAQQFKSIGVINVAADFGSWETSTEPQRAVLDLGEMKELLAVVPVVTERKIAAAKKKFEAQKTAAEQRGSSFNYDARLKSYEKTARLQGLRDRAVLTTLMCGGLRTIEISRLTVGDIGHNGGACMLSVWGKGRDKRNREAVKISRKAERVIQEWLAAREAVDVVSDASPLFCSVSNNSFGEPITSSSVSRLCKEYLRAAGLKEKKCNQDEEKTDKEKTDEEKTDEEKVMPVTAHSLRGSCATEAYNKGAKPEQIQQQLRHRSYATTQRYVRLAEKFKNPVSDLISDGIF